jgi:hypothetical protein
MKIAPPVNRPFQNGFIHLTLADKPFDTFPGHKLQMKSSALIDRGSRSLNSIRLPPASRLGFAREYFTAMRFGVSADGKVLVGTRSARTAMKLSLDGNQWDDGA